jgi:hypothetical protein
MHSVKLQGQCVLGQDLDWQGSAIQIDIAVINRHADLGIPVTEAAGSARPEKEDMRSHHALCNEARDIREKRGLVSHRNPINSINYWILILGKYGLS